MKAYLCDSIYVEWDGTDLVLTTHNGDGTSNTIVLDQYTLAALMRFLARVHAVTDED